MYMYACTRSHQHACEMSTAIHFECMLIAVPLSAGDFCVIVNDILASFCQLCYCFLSMWVRFDGRLICHSDTGADSWMAGSQPQGGGRLAPG